MQSKADRARAHQRLVAHSMRKRMVKAERRLRELIEANADAKLIDRTCRRIIRFNATLANLRVDDWGALPGCER